MMLMTYLPSLKLSLPLPSVRGTSRQVFAPIFLFCCSWMSFLMGLSKAIKPVRTFHHGLWFIANLRENWSKLAETLQTSVNED